MSKYIEPSEKVIQQLPSEQVLKNYGRSLKLLLATKDIPDLQFDATEVKEEGDPSERTEVLEMSDVDTNGSATVPQNSDFQEHSKNSLESAVGEAQEQVSEQRSVQKTVDPGPCNRTSEYREHSQKSRHSDKETSTKTVHQTFDRDAQQGNSDFREHSQNSQEKQAGADIGNVEVTVSAEIKSVQQ